MSHYQNSGCQLPSAFWGLKMHFEKGFESASFGINSIISSINKKNVFNLLVNAQARMFIYKVSSPVTHLAYITVF